MGNKFKCGKCGGGEFEVLRNTWSKEILSEQHFEIVCRKCGFGFILIEPKKSPQGKLTKKRRDEDGNQ